MVKKDHLIWYFSLSTYQISCSTLERKFLWWINQLVYEYWGYNFSLVQCDYLSTSYILYENHRKIFRFSSKIRINKFVRGETNKLSMNDCTPTLQSLRQSETSNDWVVIDHITDCLRTMYELQTIYWFPCVLSYGWRRTQCSLIFFELAKTDIFVLIMHKVGIIFTSRHLRY